MVGMFEPATGADSAADEVDGGDEGAAVAGAAAFGSSTDGAATGASGIAGISI